ncbi:hypothetical protein [Limosilactobacillus reuteri]|uniref:hypothetical protein n=1 Tax=Limosilactobacillus reuteri TaxID=1598 RepID=UPI002B05AF9C|nr:hypothetical protein [Limosilactobacillus reuteri]
MATNPPKNNARKGMVCGRSQVFNPKTNQYIKRDTKTGKFLNVKQDGTKFKGVRTEK